MLNALHDASANMRLHRLPELFCGMQRAGGMRPVLYPVSCSPQAWASGAFFMLLQGVLGILPDAPKDVLHIRQPHLPPFHRELTLSGLRVGVRASRWDFDAIAAVPWSTCWLRRASRSTCGSSCRSAASAAPTERTGRECRGPT